MTADRFLKGLKEEGEEDSFSYLYPTSERTSISVNI